LRECIFPFRHRVNDYLPLQDQQERGLEEREIGREGGREGERQTDRQTD
jgi:hypothetical protein